ncbi:GGDEF domain-containing protein [Novipirellula caenicola]|uniref:diguanylate cyclase n=1 Tax=Novipirellula caenicola TaxID=1536901 RepID=A0ABP9VTM9_9BACT
MVGIVSGLVLLAVGLMLGYRFGRKHSETAGIAMSQDERERVLQMLQELGAWTNEYSGNVSQYQSRLGELSNEVRVDAQSTQSAPKVIALLKQIMDSNEQLQTRLESAERQLDKQTKQIESYLTEARTDALTGLHNRRAFDQKLDETFATFRKGGRSFALALVDIDHFKSFNDTHGHQVGDQVLQQVAKLLQLELDDAIIVARFGGEEFAILMSVPLQIAADKMNKVRKTMASHQIDLGTKPLSVTISVGVSEPRDDLVASPVVRRADEALYAAKNIGRNRVYYHDGKGTCLVGAPEVAKG